METQKKDKVITVEIYNDPIDANYALNELKAGGIEAFVENENVVGLNPLGGLELKVFAKDVTRAKEILAH